MRKYGSSGAGFSDAVPRPERPPVDGVRGLPPYVIDMPAVRAKMAQGIPIARIARDLGVSKWTLYRRLETP